MLIAPGGNSVKNANTAVPAMDAPQAYTQGAGQVKQGGPLANAPLTNTPLPNLSGTANGVVGESCVGT